MTQNRKKKIENHVISGTKKELPHQVQQPTRGILTAMFSLATNCRPQTSDYRLSFLPLSRIKNNEAKIFPTEPDSTARGRNANEQPPGEEILDHVYYLLLLLLLVLVLLLRSTSYPIYPSLLIIIPHRRPSELEYSSRVVERRSSNSFHYFWRCHLSLSLFFASDKAIVVGTATV